jgi:predicted  nucleic acid-binding Zn-ribbon protein
MRKMLISLVAVAVAIAASCAKKDNSADTDQASHDLQKAQAAASEKRKDVATNEAEIEGKKRELIKGQQDLADKTRTLESDRQQLGSAEGTLVEARAAYAAAVKERLAKLDAALAGLATQTDATSKDAVAGLRARRDLLAAKLATMPVAADPSWPGFTHDVDTLFDAIERDLRATQR